MVLVSFQIQLLRLPRAAVACLMRRLGQSWNYFGLAFFLTSRSGGPLPLQFPGGIYLTCFFLEYAKAVAKSYGSLGQKS
jgi:hypothetical protein